MFQPSPHARHLETVFTWKLHLHLSQRTLAAGTPPLLPRPPVPKGSDGADEFLLSYWIQLKVVDLSNLNHPNEFAAVTSHQKHILSAMHKVLASTQGAEKTGAPSPGQQ